MKIKFLLYPLFVLLLFSCQSTPKKVTYFQDLDEYVQLESAQEQLKYEPVIKINDQLLITVSAPVLNQEKVAQFNLPASSYLVAGESSINRSSNLQTYTVDVDGYIDYPVVGRLKVVGMTKYQAKDYITDLISKYIENAIVNFQIISFRVTVLGEVKNPGFVSARNSRLTILEAIGATGDLTIYGNRENVLVAREIDGMKHFARLDLTKAELFSSPYYYLQQDDVVVVEPNDTRKRSSNFGAGESYQISILSLTFTAISIIISFLGMVLR
jgi:polysaccharide export outer membrane protein